MQAAFQTDHRWCHGTPLDYVVGVCGKLNVHKTHCHHNGNNIPLNKRTPVNTADGSYP